MGGIDEMFSGSAGWTSWLHLRLGSFELWQLVVGLAIVLLTLLARRLFEGIVLRWIHNFTSRTQNDYDDLIINAVGRPLSAVIIVAGLHLAASVLAGHLVVLGKDAKEIVGISFGVAIGVTVTWLAVRLGDVFAAYIGHLAFTRDTPLYRQFVPLIKKATRIFLVIVGVLTILASLEIDVAGLLAGLGIGGLAIALAAQDTLGNFFGSVALLADQPFKVGDWIQVGDKVDGDVEQIGFRSTKVRTFPKSLVTIPNRVLANEVIENWSLMPKRRVRQIVGVTYETTAPQMEKLLEAMREILRKDQDVDQDFFMVQFTDFGASSLDILVYYFTKTIKWQEHLSIRERINLEFMRCIASMGLSIAFPTHTVYFEGEVARSFAQRPRDARPTGPS